MITRSITVWADPSDPVAVYSRDELFCTYLGNGEGTEGDFLNVQGAPAERRDWLVRLILAAQAEVDRLDVAAAEPNGRAVAS